MAEAMDYVNPIIEAMVRTAQLGQQNRQLEQQKARDEETKRGNLEEEKFRRDQLKQALDLAKQAHEFTSRQQQFNLDKERFDTEMVLRNAVYQGVIPKKTEGMSLLPQQQNILGQTPQQDSIANTLQTPTGPVDISQFAGPDVMKQNLQDTTQIKAAPGIDKMIQEWQFRNQLENQKSQSAWQALLEKLDSNERMNAERYQFLRDKQNSSNFVDVPENTINDIYVTGNASLPGRMKDRTAIQSSVPSGWTPVTKVDNDQIGAIPLISNLFDTAGKLANYSYNSPVKFSERLLGIGEPGSIRQELEGQLGQVARIFGGEKGVLTEKDVARARSLFDNKKLSDKEMLKQLNDIKKTWLGKVNTVLKKYPQDQLEKILRARDIDPSTFNISQGAGKKTRIEIQPNVFVDDTPENRKKYGVE